MILILIGAILLVQCSGNNATTSVQQIDNESNEVIEPTQKVTKSNCSVDLNAAILMNDTFMLKAFLKEGCDPNTVISSNVHYYSKDTIKITALSSNNDYNLSRILLEAGADPNASRVGGGSVLSSAIAMHKNALAQLLIAYGADVNSFMKYEKYQSPKAAAIATGNFDGLKLLVEHGANLSDRREDEDSLIHEAVFRGEFEIAEYLLKSGISARETDTPFSPEGSFGDCMACPYEIEPIHWAVYLNGSSHSPQFIDLLLKYGAEINAKSRDELSPLAYIATDGKASIAKHLIKNGAAIDKIALTRSAAFQNIEYLKVLLESGGDPNASTDYYDSPLHAAITCCGDGFNETPMGERIETIQLLLKHGAVPSEKLKQLVMDNKRYSEIQF